MKRANLLLYQEEAQDAIYRTSVYAIALMLLLVSLAASSASAQSPVWKPEKNVEIVVPSGTGGGQDRAARTIQKIWQEKKFVPVTISVVNKPGAGGAIGFVYLNQHPGDAHYLAPASPSMLGSNITGQNSVGYADITPIAMLMTEHVVFAVKQDSPIKSGRDVISELKKNPASVSIAIAPALGNHEHIAMSLVAKAAGIEPRKLRTVIFNVTAESATAVLGGHVDLIVCPPATVAANVEAGKMRIIATASPQRLSGALASVPTWKEQGTDISFVGWRGIVGPKGLSPAQVSYWESIFSKLVQTEEWKKEAATDFLDVRFMGSREMTTFIESQHNEMKRVLTDLGLAKK